MNERQHILKLFELLSLLIAATCLLAPATRLHAAPGDILFSDNFNDGNLSPWSTSNFLRSGVTNRFGFAASGYGAYTRFDPVSVTSPAFNALVPGARLDIWVRRGSDAFSEDTDVTDDLLLEYLRDDNSWVVLETYEGSGTNGQIYNDSFILPPDALHAGLSLRLRQTGGSGIGYDYWHFDNVVVTELAPSSPLDVGSCDNFERGLATNWNVNTGSGYAGVSNATFSSPTNSMYLNGGSVTVTSNTIDTSSTSFGELTLWVRRGSDSFSEYPDSGENLTLEYLDDSLTWVSLETFTGGGAAGQIFSRSYDLPAAGRHNNFQLRFQQTSGSGASYDFWHVDDVCFDLSTDPMLFVEKTAQIIDDPFNGSSNPKAIPGATMQYNILVRNEGIGTTDNNSLVVREVLPANTSLFISTASGDPISFSDGSIASGLTFNYASNVRYTNQAGGGAPYNYVPVPDANGYDSNVTGFAVNPGGIMSAAAGSDHPSFTITLRIRID